MKLVVKFVIFVFAVVLLISSSYPVVKFVIFVFAVAIWPDIVNILVLEVAIWPEFVKVVFKVLV